MVKIMSTIDKKILEEISRYKNINKYISEQDVPAPPPAPAPDAGAPPAPPAAPTGAPPMAPDQPEGQPVDVEKDPDVEKIDNKGESEEEGSGVEELEITDLVTAQKDNNQKQDNYFKELFSHLENLESKLSEMDKLVEKINSLETKIEKYRPKTAQEKLELRSLDSGPYNQKLTDFFVDKEPQMQQSGKNEYVLTPNDVENYSEADIRSSFSLEQPNKFGL